MIALIPRGRLGDQLQHARTTVDVAQDHLYDALMAKAARVVRDALPTAAELLIDISTMSGPPLIGLVLRSVRGPGGTALWERDMPLATSLVAYRTDENYTWPDVVRHLEHDLTAAMGGFQPGLWWEPNMDHCEDGLFYATLPTSGEVADIQADQPGRLVVYLADRDALPYDGLWHAPPIQHPTMFVAGVAITASLADDGVLTVDIAPTGPGIPTRVRLADTAVPQHDATPTGGQKIGDRDIETDSGGPTDDHCPAPHPAEPVDGVSELLELLAWFDGDGRMRYSTDPDDAEHDNARRAGFGAAALVAYADVTGQMSDANDEMPETVMGDLLGDLRHLADALDLDFGLIDGNGAGHYDAEVRGEL